MTSNLEELKAAEAAARIRQRDSLLGIIKQAPMGE